MTLTALIVDDEEYSRQSLFYLLENIAEQTVRILGIANSVAEAKEFLSVTPVDLVFLDIAMPKENGFQLLPYLPQNRTAVIFTTAYDQYALRALKASAVDYLLKPIDIEELSVAVAKAVEWKKTVQFISKDNKRALALKSLGDNLNEKREIFKLTIQHAQGYHIINVDDILYLEADSNYSALHLQSGEKIVASKPLKDFEELLPVKNFVRIHKSLILNLNYLKNYSTVNGFSVTLNNNTELPVSRRRAADFSEKLKDFFHNHANNKAPAK